MTKTFHRIYNIPITFFASWKYVNMSITFPDSGGYWLLCQHETEPRIIIGKLAEVKKRGKCLDIFVSSSQFSMLSSCSTLEFENVEDVDKFFMDFETLMESQPISTVPPNPSNHSIT
jgi:hypothetical protein